MRACGFSILAAAALIVMGCSAIEPATRPSSLPATAPAAGSDAWWRTQTLSLGGSGAMRQDVYVLFVGRDDLSVTSEMGLIPTNAGIGATIYFWRCECGRAQLRGEIIATEGEIRDVADELSSGGFNIASMTTILITERPRLTAISFQSEGDLTDMIKTLRAALDQAGPRRMVPQ